MIANGFWMIWWPASADSQAEINVVVGDGEIFVKAADFFKDVAGNHQTGSRCGGDVGHRTQAVVFAAFDLTDHRVTGNPGMAR